MYPLLAWAPPRGLDADVEVQQEVAGEEEQEVAAEEGQEVAGQEEQKVVKPPPGTLLCWCSADGNLVRFRTKTNTAITVAEAIEWEEAQNWSAADVIVGLSNWTCGDGAEAKQRLSARLQAVRDFLAFDCRYGGYASELWPELMDMAYPELRECALDCKLTYWFARVWNVRENGVNEQQLRTMIEYCSGCAQLTLQHIVAGFLTAAYDKINPSDICQDCLTKEGLRNWLDGLTATQKGAVNWLAPKCAHFLVMCAAHHKRSLLHKKR